jgi:hypothetical protein
VRADPNDLALNRLTYYDANPGGLTHDYRFEGGCGTSGSGFAQCFPDNQLFVNLVNQLGGALAPSLMAPAGTIGYNGLYFGYEHSISNVNGDASYWHRGTEGSDPNRVPEGAGGLQRDRAPTVLFVSRFHVRKALPFGFELGLQASYLHDSSMVAMGFDLRWALFEGFRTGVGYLPDFAVRGSVNTLVGNPQLYLTVVGLDASLSKAIPIAGMMALTPYAGGQALFILGDSAVIDTTPSRSSFQECPRRQTTFSTDASGHQSSQLVCTGGTGGPATGVNDSLNDVVFQQTRLLRWRAFAGLRYTLGIFTLTGEFAIDLLDRPDWLNGATSVVGAGRPSNSGAATIPTLDAFRQWTTTFGAGVTFR